LTAVVLPAAFVVLWGSGFIAAKVGVAGAEPMTFLALRYAIVTALMGVVVVVSRAPWPASRAEAAHIAVAGVFMQTVYFGAAWVSMSQGVGAAVAAIIVTTHPVLTAMLAGPVLGERVSPRQAVGFVLGLAGVVLVVANKLALGLGTPVAMAWSVLSLLGMTIGTLYQKRYCPRMDPRSGGVIQFAVGCATALPLALLFEDMRIAWSIDVALALVYVSVVISLVSVTLLAVMIRRGEVTRGASLFFLVPPVAAVVAWLVLGETLAPLSILGMAVAAAGVALVVAPARA
jgi:drug/metabolite transporter (DMT)-like permease